MSIKENILFLKDNIEKIKTELGREKDNIRILGVTKNQRVEKISELLCNGIKIFGENKIQEALQKIPLLKDEFEEFHFIGVIQTNKLRKLLSLKPTLIHSVERFKVADKISKISSERGFVQNILIQVNSSYEKTKSGVDPAECKELVKKISKLQNVKIVGLMTIGANSTDILKIEHSFKIVQNLFNELRGYNNTNFKYLSMGMSHDYPLAIKCGANILRIGSGIFKKRNFG